MADVGIYIVENIVGRGHCTCCEHGCSCEAVEDGFKSNIFILHFCFSTCQTSLFFVPLSKDITHYGKPKATSRCFVRTITFLLIDWLSSFLPRTFLAMCTRAVDKNHTYCLLSFVICQFIFMSLQTSNFVLR